MTLLHMDTDDVSSLADYLNRAANEIIDTTHDLRRSANRLNGKWHGGRSDQFLRRLSSAANAAADVAEDAVRLSLRVRAEVDEWLEVDRDGAGQVLGAVAPLPTPVPTPTPIPGRGGDGEDIGDGIKSVGDFIDIALAFFAGAVISTRPGTSYPDQLIINGPPWAKDLKDLSPNLTHIKKGNLGGHVMKGITNTSAISLIGPILSVYEHWLDAVTTPHDDDLRAATAMFIDTVVIMTVTIGVAKGITALAALLGLPIGGVGGIVTGVIGAAAGGWVAGWIVDKYLQSPMREKLIDAVVNFIRPPANLEPQPEFRM